MNNSPEITNVAKAFIKARSEIGQIIKNKHGLNFKYADFPQVIEVISAVTMPNDLVFFQPVGPMKDELISVKSMLLHSSGEYISQWAQTVMFDNEKLIKNRIQRARASITHLKRTSAISFWFLAEEDEIDSIQDNGAMVATDNGRSTVMQYEKMQDFGEKDLLGKLRVLISKSSNPIMTEKAIIEKNRISRLEDLLAFKDELASLVETLQRKVS